MTYARMEGDYNIVYHETLDYAFKHGEPELFRMSRRCDYDCCSRIVDMTERWSTDTEEERRERQMKIVEEFGLERCLYIMAATVRGNSRIEFSGELHDWAEKIRISDDRFVNATNVILSKLEPLLDFIATVQRLEAEEKKKAEEAEKAEAEKAETEKAAEAEKAEKAEGEKAEAEKAPETERAETEAEGIETDKAEGEKAETEAEKIEAENGPATKRAARPRRAKKPGEEEKSEEAAASSQGADEKNIAEGEETLFEKSADEALPDSESERDGEAEAEGADSPEEKSAGAEGASGEETDRLDAFVGDGDDLPSAATMQYGEGGDARDDLLRARVNLGADGATRVGPEDPEEEETEEEETDGDDQDGDDQDEDDPDEDDPDEGEGETLRDSSPAAAGESADDRSAAGETGWTQIPLPPSAVIQDYGTNFYLRMPRAGTLPGYVYNLPASLVRRTDTGYVASLPANFEVRCRRDAGEPQRTLTVDEYVSAVVGFGEEDYRRRDPRDNEKIVEIRLPRNALLERRERSFRFTFPDRYAFFVGKSLVSEDREGFTIRMRENYRISAYKGPDLKYFTPEEAARTAEEANWEGFLPIDGWRENEWQNMRISKRALVYENERRMLFRMPDGDMEDCSYYYPKKLVTDAGDCYVFRLPPDFRAELFQDGSDVVKEMDAMSFFEAVCGKGDECYTEDLERPSRIAARRFEYEQRLRDNVPKEMKDKPNWVVVRTAKSAGRDKLDKYLISPVTGKFAESDNPSTWTDFETACRYARENGGDTLAYALDGKGVCCLDIDRCVVDNLLTAKAATAVDAAPRGTYLEKSVSGNGIHIFGTLSETMAIRSFSRDGGLEFYRNSHFISMTGEAQSANMRLLSFDTPQMKVFLRNNFDKRLVYKNAGRGMEGVSVMSDRELLEKAFASKGGDTMKRLFAGEDLQNNHSNSDMALMNRLAFWCNGDREQMMRLFCASGLYRPEKSQDYYECTVLKALEGVTDRYDFRRDEKTRPDPKRPDPKIPDGDDKGDKT